MCFTGVQLSGDGAGALELDLLAKSYQGAIKVKDPTAAEEDEGVCRCVCVTHTLSRIVTHAACALLLACGPAVCLHIS